MGLTDFASFKQTYSVVPISLLYSSTIGCSGHGSKGGPQTLVTLLCSVIPALLITRSGENASTLFPRRSG